MYIKVMMKVEQIEGATVISISNSELKDTGNGVIILKIFTEGTTNGNENNIKPIDQSLVPEKALNNSGMPEHSDQDNSQSEKDIKPKRDVKTYQKTYYERNKEKLAEQARKYYADNKDKKIEYQKQKLQDIDKLNKHREIARRSYYNKKAKLNDGKKKSIKTDSNTSGSSSE
jgi:hypothetical protein